MDLKYGRSITSNKKHFVSGVEETGVPGVKSQVTDNLYHSVHCCIDYTSPEWDSKSQRYICSIKMMKTIPDQLGSYRYDVYVKK
jgi:hypothetical protein